MCWFENRNQKHPSNLSICPSCTCRFGTFKLCCLSLTLCFLLSDQDEPADTDQSHGPTYGTAANSRRLRQTGAAAVSFSLSNALFISFLFSQLFKLSNVQTSRYLVCFRAFLNVCSVQTDVPAAVNQYSIHCAVNSTQLWYIYVLMGSF